MSALQDLAERLRRELTASNLSGDPERIAATQRLKVWGREEILRLAAEHGLADAIVERKKS